MPHRNREHRPSEDELGQYYNTGYRLMSHSIVAKANESGMEAAKTYAWRMRDCYREDNRHSSQVPRSRASNNGAIDCCDDFLTNNTEKGETVCVKP